MKPKFVLGKIEISVSVAKRLDGESLQTALKRYADCDWGHVPKKIATQNDDIVKRGCLGGMLAHYYDSQGIEFWFTTDRLGEPTSVIIPDDYKKTE